MASFTSPPLFPFLLPLHSNLDSFCAIIRRCHFLKPRMLQCLLRRNAVRRIVYKDLAEEIEEISVESGIAWYDVLEYVSCAQ